jgi:uncharacterized protein YndB with AHSA1/START domain
MTATTVDTRVFRVFIRATPQQIWDAIIDPAWNVRYGYRARADYELRPGGRYLVQASEEMAAHGAPSDLIEGEVLELDPPHRLVQTWHAHFSPETTAEGATRLTWEITPRGATCELTVTHELGGAPVVAAIISGDEPAAGGGWPWMLCDMKTLLETGETLPI